MRFLHKMFNLNDPGWGRGSDDQKNDQKPPRRPNSGGPGGPPDLDQVWRDFNKRLNNLFGGGAVVAGQTHLILVAAIILVVV
jgi:membrane protease subunit HflK